MELLKLLPAGKDCFWDGTRLKEENRGDRYAPIGRNLGMPHSSGYGYRRGEWEVPGTPLSLGGKV